MSNITTYTTANGIAYYSTTNENGETIYSFTEDFEDIWSQDDQDLHMSTTKRVLWTDPNEAMSTPIHPVVGQRLFTRDGRIIGNAIITETKLDPEHGFMARFETDFGDGKTWLSLGEIARWWWTERDGEPAISPVDEWRADREQVRDPFGIMWESPECKPRRYTPTSDANIKQSAEHQKLIADGWKLRGWLPNERLAGLRDELKAQMLQCDHGEERLVVDRPDGAAVCYYREKPTP